ncbi:protein unc-13 homolog D-like isoform X3 [Anneissia japonica]|uniref:protein unc-13 homolog D-like isoform X3 n=1 Tax=Anneissia japonica TaxID=1529436 RepID=UPI0014254FF5|nr:protein unc-13 homolog D-like isoform X3 [Anneissia japonica]
MEIDVSEGLYSPPTVIVTDSCHEKNVSLDELKPGFSNSQRRHSSVDLKSFFGISERGRPTVNEIAQSRPNGVAHTSELGDTIDLPIPPQERRRSFSGLIQGLSLTRVTNRMDASPTKENAPYLHRQYEFESGGLLLDETGIRERSRSVGELTNNLVFGDVVGGVSKIKRLFSKTDSETDLRTSEQRQNDLKLKHARAESCTLPVGIRPDYKNFADDKKRWSMQPTPALTWGRRRVSQLLDFDLKSLFKQEKATNNVSLLDEEGNQNVDENHQDNDTAIELSSEQTITSLVSTRQQLASSEEVRSDDEQKDKSPAVESYEVLDDDDETIEIINDNVENQNNETTPNKERSHESNELQQIIPPPNLAPKLKRNRFAGRKRHGQTKQQNIQQDEFVEFYNQVVRTLLHPLGKFDCSGISPLELVSHLQKVLNVDQALHSSLIKDQVNKLPEKVILKLRVIEAKDLKPMDSNGLSDPYFMISLGTKTASRSGTLERKSNPNMTPQVERKTDSSEHSETTPTSEQLKKDTSIDDGAESRKNKKQKKIARIKSTGKGDAKMSTDSNATTETAPSGDQLKKEGSVDDGSEKSKNKKQKKITRNKSGSKGDIGTKVVSLDEDGDDDPTYGTTDQLKREGSVDDGSEKLKNKKQKKVARNKSAGKGDMGTKLSSMDGDGDEEPAYRTTVAKETLHPIWNEIFLIEVTNVEDQQLQMFLWDWDEEGSLWNVTKSLDRKHKLAGVQTIFRHMKQTMEHGKSMDDFMGQFSVSLCEISASSRIDKWYKIKKQSKTYGQCRLQMQFVMKSGDEDNTVSHVVMYYKLSKAIHKYEGELTMQEGSWDGKLSAKSKLALDLYAVQRGLTQMAALNIDLAALLEFFVEMKAVHSYRTETDQNTKEGHTLDEKAIQEATIAIHAEKLAMSSLAIYGLAGKGSEEDMSSHQGIAAPEPSDILESSASLYITECLKKLDECPAFFPPTHVEILDQVNEICRLDSIQSLLKVKFENIGSGIIKKVQGRIVSVIKDHTKQWLHEVLQQVTLPDGDIESEELCDKIQKLNEVIRQVTVICRTNDAFKKFFNKLQVDYFVVVSEEVDQSVSKVLQNVLSKTDSFLQRHKKVPEKVNDASIATLQLYMTVKLIRFLLKQNVPSSDELDIINFHDWFQNSLIFWMMTFRYETFNRVLKALEMDKDVKLVHAVVKYSNSAVDVQSCFAKVTEEWQNINFGCIDSRLMAITKITILVCDGAKLYADKLYGILAENGFYEGGKDGSNFDIKDKLCITLNNIEHVRAYLDNLPSLLSWERNVEALAKHHGNEDAGKRTYNALQRLTNKTSEAILMKTAQMEQQIAQRMCAEVRKSIKHLVNDPSKQDESLDAVLKYIDTNLQTMYNQLMPQIFPRITKALWIELLARFVALIKNGQEISYYENLKSNLEQLESYFQHSAVILKDWQMHNLDYAYLSGELQINLQTTEQLLLKFFAILGNDMVTQKDDWGHIEVQVGMQTTDNNKAIVHVKVLNATNLPGMDADGTSDPFVLVELCPEVTFHKNKTHKTRTISSNLNPVFNEAFEFHVSMDSLALMGAVLQFTVMDHDLLWYDDFIGEVFIPLDQAFAMQDGQTIDHCPTKVLPIKRPHEEEMPVCYQVLKARSKWDKDARNFTTKRQATMKMKKSRTDKPLKLTPNNSLKTKKNDQSETTITTEVNEIAVPTIVIDEAQMNGNDC